MSKIVLTVTLLGVLCPLTSCAILKKPEAKKPAPVQEQEPQPKRKPAKKATPKPKPKPSPKPTPSAPSITLQKDQGVLVTPPTVYDSEEGPRHPIQLQ